MICAEIKTIHDDDAKIHTTCVAKIPNQHMDIVDTATRTFTRVTEMALDTNNGNGLPQYHPEL